MSPSLVTKDKQTSSYVNETLLEVKATSINPTITKTVMGGVSTVNLEQTFTYAIDFSFSGITNLIPPSFLVDELPEFIDILSLPSTPDSPLLSIDTLYTIGVGTKLTFNFDTIDPGQSLHYEMTCRFKTKTASSTKFTNNLKYYYVSNPTTIAQNIPGPTVTLIVNPIIEYRKELVVPTTPPGPAPGGAVLFQIFIENTGDAGALLTGITLTDVLPDNFTLDTGFDVICKDITPNSYFADPSQDKTFKPSSGTLTITLDNYYGTLYRVIFRAFIDNDASLIGETRTNIVKKDGTTVATTDVTISAPIYYAGISKSGPTHASPGNNINYEIYFGNVGNQDLTSIVLEDTIPDGVNVYSVSSGSYGISIIGYYPPLNVEIYYDTETTTNNLLATSTYDYDQFFNITVPVGDRVTKVRWLLPSLPVGVATIAGPKINGVINISVTLGSTITNFADLTFSPGPTTVGATAVTIVDGLSDLLPGKGVYEIIRPDSPYEYVPPYADVEPEDEITYMLIADTRLSQLNNPVFVDILPPEVEFVDVVKYEYYNFFTGQYAFSANPSDFLPNVKISPDIYIFPNFEGSRTLVRFTFNNTFVEQRGFLNVYIKVRVKIGAKGVVANNYILGNIGPNSTVNENIAQPYTEVGDIDGDGVLNETNLALSNTVTNNIKFSTKVRAIKFVKGALDSDYSREPAFGYTYESGAVDYKLLVLNNGNADLTSIEIIDILPHVGDTGVLVNQDRLSDFPIYSIGAVTAEILDSSNKPIGTATIQVYYNDGYAPERFDNFGNPIGSGAWTSTPPSPITKVGSFKVYTKTILHPGETLKIDVRSLAPFGVIPKQIAWNSFAYRVSYINPLTGLETFLLPAEPRKVGVTVLVPESPKTSLGNYVWFDINGNGLQDEPESAGINGVIVTLFDKKGNQIGLPTITANNAAGKPGYYLFNNLTPGDYYVTFSAPNGLEPTTKYAGSTDINSDNNSKPNKQGKTDVITLVADTPNLKVDAGFINRGLISGLVKESCKDTPNPDGPGFGDLTLEIASEDGTYYNTTTTLPSGLYKFENLPYGCYYISVLTPPAGYTENYVPPMPVCISEEDPKVEQVNFSYCREGSISGTIYNNCNGDNGDPIPGITVTLTNGDTVTTTTDSNGYYIFEGLDGSLCYTVTITVPDGYTLKYGDNPREICLSDYNPDEKDVTGIDFGLCKKGSISGTIYNNCTGDPDDNGAPIPGVTVTLVTGASMTTDANGAYSFEGLDGDSCYTVTITVPNGYTLKYGDNPSVVCLQDYGPDEKDVTGVDFGLCKKGSISGNIYNNCTGDPDDNGAPIPGVTVTLVTGASMTTDANGAYSFEGLDGDSCYTVTITVPNGYTLKYGDNPSVVCLQDYTPDEKDVTGIDFGLCKLTCIEVDVVVDNICLDIPLTNTVRIVDGFSEVKNVKRTLMVTQSKIVHKHLFIEGYILVDVVYATPYCTSHCGRVTKNILSDICYKVPFRFTTPLTNCEVYDIDTITSVDYSFGFKNSCGCDDEIIGQSTCESLSCNRVPLNKPLKVNIPDYNICSSMFFKGFNCNNCLYTLLCEKIVLTLNITITKKKIVCLPINHL